MKLIKKQGYLLGAGTCKQFYFVMMVQRVNILQKENLDGIMFQQMVKSIKQHKLF